MKAVGGGNGNRSAKNLNLLIGLYVVLNGYYLYNLTPKNTTTGKIL